MGVINDGFSTIFTTLKDTEIKIDDALSSKNKKIPLKTVADVMKNLKNDDRQVRKST
jgi:oligoendopeptidase F